MPYNEGLDQAWDESVKAWIKSHSRIYQQKFPDAFLRAMIAADAHLISTQLYSNEGGVDLVRNKSFDKNQFEIRFSKQIVMNSPTMRAKHGLPIVWKPDSGEFRVDGREMTALWKHAMSKEYQREYQNKVLLSKQFSLISKYQMSPIDGIYHTSDDQSEYSKTLLAVSERLASETLHDLRVAASQRDDAVMKFQTAVKSARAVAFVLEDSEDFSLVKYITKAGIYNSMDDAWSIGRIRGEAFSGTRIEYCIFGDIEMFRNDVILHRVTN